MTAPPKPNEEILSNRHNSKPESMPDFPVYIDRAPLKLGPANPIAHSTSVNDLSARGSRKDRKVEIQDPVRPPIKQFTKKQKISRPNGYMSEISEDATPRESEVQQPPGRRLSDSSRPISRDVNSDKDTFKSSKERTLERKHSLFSASHDESKRSKEQNAKRSKKFDRLSSADRRFPDPFRKKTGASTRHTLALSKLAFDENGNIIQGDDKKLRKKQTISELVVRSEDNDLSKVALKKRETVGGQSSLQFSEQVWARVTLRDPISNQITGRDWRKFYFVTNNDFTKLLCYENRALQKELTEHTIDLSKVVDPETEILISEQMSLDKKYAFTLVPTKALLAANSEKGRVTLMSKLKRIIAYREGLAIQLSQSQEPESINSAREVKPNLMELQEIVTKLMGPGGIPMKDRRWLLKTYRYCFVGQEFVDWLIHHAYANTREEAERLGREMEDARLIEHVSHDHPFKDENQFYRVTKRMRRLSILPDETHESDHSYAEDKAKEEEKTKEEKKDKQIKEKELLTVSGILAYLDKETPGAQVTQAIQSLLSDQKLAEEFIKGNGISKLIAFVPKTNLLLSTKILAVVEEFLAEPTAFKLLFVSGSLEPTAIVSNLVDLLLAGHSDLSSIPPKLYALISQIPRFAHKAQVQGVAGLMLSIFDLYTLRSGEEHRFEHLMYTLKNVRQVSAQVALLSVINAIIGMYSKVSDRCRIRNEFVLLGLEDYLVDLQNVDELVKAQIDAFVHLRTYDNERSPRVKGIPAESSSLAGSQLDQQTGKNQRVQRLFLEFLAETEKSQPNDKGMAKWLIVSKILAELASDSNNPNGEIDIDALFKSEGKDSEAPQSSRKSPDSARVRSPKSARRKSFGDRTSEITKNEDTDKMKRRKSEPNLSESKKLLKSPGGSPLSPDDEHSNFSWKKRLLEREAENRARIDYEAKLKQSIGKAIRARQLTVGVDRTEVEVMPDIEEATSVEEGSSAKSVGTPVTPVTPTLQPSTSASASGSTKTEETYPSEEKSTESNRSQLPIKKLNFDNVDQSRKSDTSSESHEKNPQNELDHASSTSSGRAPDTGRKQEFGSPVAKDTQSGKEESQKSARSRVNDHSEESERTRMQKLYQFEMSRLDGERKKFQALAQELEKEKNELAEILQSKSKAKDGVFDLKKRSKEPDKERKKLAKEKAELEKEREIVKKDKEKYEAEFRKLAKGLAEAEEECDSLKKERERLLAELKKAQTKEKEKEEKKYGRLSLKKKDFEILKKEREHEDIQEVLKKERIVIAAEIRKEFEDEQQAERNEHVAKQAIFDNVVARMNAELTTLKAKIHALEESKGRPNSEIGKGVQATDAERKMLEEQQSDVEVQLKQLEEKRAQVTSDRALLDNEHTAIINLREKISQERDRLQQIANDLRQKQTLMAEAETQISEKKDKFMQLQAMLDQETQRLEKKRQEFTTETTFLEKESARVTQRKIELRTENTILDSEDVKLEEKRRRINLKAAELSAQKEELSEQRDLIEKEREEVLQEELQLEKMRDEIEKDRELLNKEMDEIDEKKASLEDEAEILAEMQQQLDEKRQQMEADVASTKFQELPEDDQE